MRFNDISRKRWRGKREELNLDNLLQLEKGLEHNLVITNILSSIQFLDARLGPQLQGVAGVEEVSDTGQVSSSLHTKTDNYLH